MNPSYRNILVFDTETTGLIQKNAPLEEYPYITQFSFIVYDIQNEMIRSSFNTYIKIPSNVIINDYVSQLTGVTNDICEERGIPITEALGIFYHTMSVCDCVIGHNIDFDIQMVNIEIVRNLHSLQHFPDIKNIFNTYRLFKLGIKTDCTMRMTINSCSLYRTNEKNQKYKKFPKLVETYYHLFNETPENLHNSMVDTLICLRCYLKIKFNIFIDNIRFNELINEFL
jgi:DNA polymerase III epsilon subunit-like protein